MRLREDLKLRQIGEEFLIVEAGQGMIDFSKVFSLNKVAAYLWAEFYGKDFEESDMCSSLIERFEVEPLVAEKDVSKIIQHFRNEKLII